VNAIAVEIRDTELGAALAAPERLLSLPGVRFVKDHRRTAVAAAALGGREVFVKRFKPYAWYRRLEWWLTSTPARRCWQRSLELERAGFRVAPALAFGETRWLGLPADSYFVSGSLAGAEPAGRFWLTRSATIACAERRALLRALARELRRFHDAGFYSRDANADNFLVTVHPEGGAEFFLLDLEHVRRIGRVSRRRRAKNIVQLYRPIRGRVPLADRVRFVRAYLGETAAGLAAWLDDLARLDDKKETEYRARRRRRRAD